MKKIRIFLGEKEDKKKIFETIRMALGITLKGHIVELYISKDINFDMFEEKDKKEIEEFLQAIKYMNGKWEFVEDIKETINQKVIEKGFYDIVVI